VSDTPIDRLLRAVDPADGDEAKASNFARGLVLGALVGAAIAGSTLWQRRHARGAAPPDTAPGTPAASADADREKLDA
jgi:hypothetical protein